MLIFFITTFFNTDICKIGKKRPPESYTGALTISETITQQKPMPCNRPTCKKFSTYYSYT